MQVQLGHTHNISQVTYTSDGLRLISAGDDTIRIWDVRNGRLINVIGGIGTQGPFVVSPDSQRIALTATTQDKVILIIAPLSKLDAATQVPLGENDHLNNISVIAFHPTDPNLITMAYRDHLAIFDLTQQKIIKEFSIHKSNWRQTEIVYGATPDGSRAVSGSVLDEIRVWDVTKGSCLAVITPPLVPLEPSQPDSLKIKKLVLSDDGSLLAVSVSEPNIHIWSIPEGRELVAIRTGDNYGKDAIAISPDNKHLAVGENSQVVIYDLVKGTKLLTIDPRHGKEIAFVRTVQFSKKNDALAYGTSLPLSSNGDNSRMLGTVNVKTGKIIQLLSGIDWWSYDIDVAEKARKLVYTPYTENPRRPIWDLNSLFLEDIVLLHPEKGGWGQFPSCSLDKKADKMFIAGYVWALNPLKVLFGEKLSQKEQHAKARFLGNNSVVLVKADSLEIVDLATKNVTWRANGYGNQVPFTFSSDNRTVAIARDIWTVGSDKPFAKLDIQGDGGLKAMSMVANDTLVAVFGPEQSGEHSFFLGIYSVSNGRELKRQRLPSVTWYTTAAFAPDGSRAWIGDQKGSIQEWDLHTMKIVQEWQVASSRVEKLIFLPDLKCIALRSSVSPVISLLQIKTGHLLHLISSGDAWIVYTEDGYFDCSPEGAALVNIIAGNSAFGIDQFAAQLNRPDIILKRFGLGAQDQIQHFHRQYQRRLRKLGIPEEGGSFVPHVPKIKINQASNKGAQARLAFSMGDDLYPIRSYQIYVNGVPLFNGGGKNAAGKTEVEEEITLSQGLNRVELSCMNEVGAESFREMTQFTLDETVRRRLFYVGIGVSKYKDASLDLSYADKDAQDLADTFARMGGPLDEVKVTVFSNDMATREAFRKASDLLSSAGVNDTVVIFLAGHGLHDRDPDATYYFLTHEAKLTNLSATGANFDIIEDLMAGVAARQKLLLLDTCESGELEESMTSNYLAQAASRGIRSRSIRNNIKDTRGMSVVSGTPSKSPRPYLLNRDRLILMDMTRRTGSIIFSASRGNEFSYESEKIKNGYFTAGLLRSLRGEENGGKTGLVTTAEIRDQVRKWVIEQTGGLQNPTVDRDNIYQSFGFPTVKGDATVH